MQKIFKFFTIIILIFLFILYVGAILKEYLVGTILGDILLYIELMPSFYAGIISMVCGAIMAAWFVMLLDNKKNNNK